MTTTKHCFLIFTLVVASFGATAQEMHPIKLNAPSKDRGASVMKALWNRQSTREFSDKKLSLQDLSDLLWAANGVNRPADSKRTAPSALNKQDIKVYLCTDTVNYLYDAKTHTLIPISSQDVRPLKAPVCLILVSDNDEGWAPIDAGIVSQNISLFCAGVGLGTVPRGTMDKEVLRKVLKLKPEQQLQLNHPVGYPKQQR